MSEATAPLPVRPAVGRALNLELHLSWELVAYASFVVIGAGMRFWDLGSRALHHDESLHGFYAYDIFLGRGFEHNPLLHGPFQFFGTALTFFLSGGASDYTVRIFPALFGGALVVLPFFFRDRLGRLGALFASGLIAFSPTLLYFSRFARNDIYVAVFTLGIVISLWRYVDERKPLFLYLAAGLLALSFATKENTFINVAILLVFLNLWVAADLARQSREEKGEPPSAYPFYLLLYVPWAWAITALWPLIGGIRQALGLRERSAAGDFLVVLGTLSLPQFAASVQVPLESLGFELDTLGREKLVGIPTVLTLLAATAFVGLGWNWRVWLLAAAAFYVPYALLFTSFGTYGEGFASGIWDSLDYWLDQHEVRRGDQPDFYYVMLLPAYEFLALAFAGPALLYFSLRGGPRSWLFTAVATFSLLAFFGADSFSESLGAIAAPVTLPVAALALYFAVRGSVFERFLVFWTAAALVGYSWVGEKMPWLSVHTTLPVVILAAYSLGRLFQHPPSPAGLMRYAGAGLPLVAAGLGLAAVTFAAFAPGDNGLWLGLAAVAPVPLLALVPPLGRRRLAAVVAAAVFGGLALFSVRAAVVASFEHGDVAREMLVYTQTSPDVPDVMERIERIADTSGRGRDLRVVVDTTYTWPWAWYLRDYNIAFVDFDGTDEEFDPPEDAVLLIARENEGRVDPILDRYQEPELFRLRWWFPEVYREVGRDNLWLATRDFGRSLTRGDTWENWWRFFRDRQPPKSLGSVDSTAYFPLMYDPSARPDIEGRLTIGRGGDAPGALNDPSGLAVDGEGNLYIADAGNGRIQKFAPDGRILKSIGRAGRGKGKFNQPADLALDGKGNVYVIDTWNHRVQKFDADLNFLTTWGRPTTNLVNPGDDEMWGPRSIAVDSKGKVWIVDTGTHRVRKYSPNGKLLATVGERGKNPGQFREPVGITVDPVSGHILVADAGNARIQRFDTKLNPIAAYVIDEWRDLDPTNKPDLAALPDGRILASDPAHGRILLVDSEGQVVAALDSVAGEAFSFPRGIAYDAEGRFVFVSDGSANQVRRFPLSDFAFR